MRLRENFIGFYTIVHKEITRVLRIWPQTLLPPAIMMMLYFVIFGNLIGRRIGEMGGFEYTSYIAPGLIMMAVIQNSYANVVSSFFGAKFGRHIEELLVSPMPNWLILMGYVVGGVCRGLLVGLLVTIVALFFTRLTISNPIVVITVVLATSVLFALGGFINAVYAKKFDDVSIIPTFVLTPLTYLGGVFFSIDLLPSFWQGAAQVNPILHMVNAFRYGVLGVSDVPIVFAYFMIAVVLVLGFWMCLYLLERGVGLRT